jgi:integrase
LAQLELPLPAPRPRSNAVVTTLTDVVERLNANPELSIRRRHDMISALRTLARLVDLPLSSMPATPPSLREYFERASPAAGGFRKGHWHNIRSRSLAALKQAGVRTMARRTREPLAPKWDDLRVLLPSTRFRAGLSRFMSYCSIEGTSPTEVTPTTFERFGVTVHTSSSVRQPQQVCRTARLLWNKAGAEIPGWPAAEVPVPNRSRRYAMDWGDFSSAFLSNVEAFLNRLGNPNVFAEDYARPVEPSTRAMRRGQIRQLATALVRSGVPAEEITSLASLVRPDNAERALRFLYDRAGGKKTKYLHQQAILLKTIARHWVKAEPGQVEALATFARNLTVKKIGMTDKNRARLRQFDNPGNVVALTGLCPRIFDEARRHDGGRRQDAHRFMLSFATHLLLNVPMRVMNLTGLDLDRHFVRTRVGGIVTTHIVIPGNEIKNDRPLEVELRADTARLFSIYCEDYRPRLASVESRWLFPNYEGKRRNTRSFGTMISHFLLRETGIRINVHLFRHLGAKLYLAEHPGDIETVRLILGHANTSTTLMAYADLRTGPAFRRYDEFIANLDEPTVIVPHRRSIRTAAKISASPKPFGVRQ